MGNYRSIIASLVLLASACKTDLFQPLPVDHIDINSWPGVVQVADTLRITVSAFNSQGYMSSHAGSYSWNSTDAPNRITLEQILPRVPDGSGILVRGQSVGMAHVEVTANGNLSSSALIEVIPKIARIIISPSTVTVAAGDTVRLKATVITSAGDTLTGHQLIWRTNPEYSPVATTGPLVLGWAPGSVEITATLAGATGRSQVTVIPHSP